MKTGLSQGYPCSGNRMISDVARTPKGSHVHTQTRAMLFSGFTSTRYVLRGCNSGCYASRHSRTCGASRPTDGYLITGCSVCANSTQRANHREQASRGRAAAAEQLQNCIDVFREKVALEVSEYAPNSDTNGNAPDSLLRGDVQGILPASQRAR